MTDELIEYEATIKKKSSFNWTPKFEEGFHTKLNNTVFVPIAIKTFEKLGWDLVYQDESSAEAKRKGKKSLLTHKISVSFNFGKVSVKSVSLGSEMWDNGQNSLRVRLFIYAFQQTEKEFDREGLRELEKEIEKKRNWDDYEIPTSLPQPKYRKKPQFWIPLVGGVLTSLIIGIILAFISAKGIYLIGLFELGVAMLIGLALKQLINASNYTHYNHLNYLLIGIVILTFLSNQFFQYQIIINENNFEMFSFFQFLEMRLEAGLTIKTLNTGWIGLALSWIFQLEFTYLIATFLLVANLTTYQLTRVPIIVSDFVTYHFVKEKSEDQVREQLSKMGWTDKQDQDEVFEAIGAINTSIEFNRME